MDLQDAALALAVGEDATTEIRRIRHRLRRSPGLDVMEVRRPGCPWAA